MKKTIDFYEVFKKMHSQSSKEVLENCIEWLDANSKGLIPEVRDMVLQELGGRK